MPYTSPLFDLHNIKYHPKFQTWFQDGFRSGTFFHKMTDYGIICLYETLGGVCNDKACHSLHFRDAFMTG